MRPALRWSRYSLRIVSASVKGRDKGDALSVEGGETPLLGDNDLLSSRELVLGTTEGLHDDGLVVVLATDGEDDLSNVDSGDGSVGLSPCSSHTRLQSIGTGAGQHLVDADNVEGVDSDTEMERVLAGGLDDVLVGANTGGLEGLGRELLVLVGNYERQQEERAE